MIQKRSDDAREEPIDGSPGRAVRLTRGFWIKSTLLFTFALLIRLVYVYHLADTPFADDRLLLWDARYYDMRAREIAAGDLVGSWVAFLSPGYCYVIGALYCLFGADLWPVRILQALLGSFSCVLLYWLGRRMFSEAVGVLAAGILAVYGLHIYYTGLMLPTILVVFLNLLLLVVLYDRRRIPAWWRCLMGGMALGLAVTAKANAMLLLPAVVLWIWLAFPDGKRRRTTRCGLVAIGTVLMIAPLTWRNYLASGEFVLVTATGGLNLLKGNGPQATGSHVPKLLPDVAGVNAYVTGQVDPGKAVAGDRALMVDAVRFMLAHPGRTVRLWMKKFLLFFNALELSIRDHFYFARTRLSFLQLPWLSFGLVAPLGLAGLLTTWRGSPRRRLLHAVFAVQVASFVLLFVLARYRLVAVVCLTLFAAQLCVRLVGDVRQGRWNALLRSVALLLPAVLLVHAPAPTFTTEHGLADQYAFIGDYHFKRREYGLALEAYESALQSSWHGFERRERVRAKIARVRRSLDRRNPCRRTVFRRAGPKGVPAVRVRMWECPASTRGSAGKIWVER